MGNKKIQPIVHLHHPSRHKSKQEPLSQHHLCSDSQKRSQHLNYIKLNFESSILATKLKTRTIWNSSTLSTECSCLLKGIDHISLWCKYPNILKPSIELTKCVFSSYSFSHQDSISILSGINECQGPQYKTFSAHRASPKLNQH